MHYKLDKKTISEDEALADKFGNSKMNALLNGSGINNIPNLNIITTNSDIELANKCGDGPLKVDYTSINDSQCQKICLTSNASALMVNEGENIAYNNAELSAGAYCLLGDKPECDLQTTYAVMTLNSVVCYPKYPELFGGTDGRKIVACNDSSIYDSKNYLYDGLTQSRVYNTSGIIMTSDGADEKLPDGTYRFTCKFEGEDPRGNRYLQHPLNRFHPIKNRCAELIYRSHPDVKSVFEEDGTITCDCGDIKETRVSNINPNDKTSQCSSIQSTSKVLNKSKLQVTIPYPCFTLYSPISHIGTMLPCPTDQFTRQGNLIGEITLVASTDPTAAIMHGEYNSMVDGTTGGV